MARPIKETPILFGEEARRFEERMKNVKPLSKERIAEIRRDYEYMMSMFMPTNRLSIMENRASVLSVITACWSWGAM